MTSTPDIKRIISLISGLALVLLLGSCRVLHPSQMLSTGKNYPYADLPKEVSPEEYRIAPNDELMINVATNGGERLLDPVSGTMGGAQGAISNTYLVEFDGMVKLPVINRIKLSGFTLREAEKALEEKFVYYFNKPYVQVKVTNNRVIIFPGGLGGSAQVLRLENPNTTLFEALAKAGGISDGKAYRIKLIRGNLNDRKVYLIDLSKIDGLRQADIVLMANDIIYVEPVNKVPQAILAEIAPYLSLFTTLLLIYSLFIK